MVSVRWLTLVATLFMASFGTALSRAMAQDAPQSFTLDGRLFSDPQGTIPLEDALIGFKVQILDEAETCVLYEEEQDVNTATSKGYFSIRVGSAVGSPRRTVDDSANTMATVFQNVVATNGKLLSNGNACAVPATAGKRRYVRIVVSPNSLGGAPRILSPNLTIDSVPNAIVAERAESVQGFRGADLLKVNTTAGAALTQSNLESLFTSVGRFNSLTAVVDGTSSNYVQTSANGARLPVIAGAPATPAQGSIWFDTGDNRLKFYDGTAPVTISSGGNGISGTAGIVPYFATATTLGDSPIAISGTNVGVGTTTPGFPLAVGNGVAADGGIIAQGYGAVGTGTALGLAGAGKKMIWYPRKAAFRAGSTLGTEWDDANIGNWSIAMGNSSVASGAHSVAIGSLNTASGSYSFAMGNGSTASGDTSTAFGASTANGNLSFSNGLVTTADSYLQTTIGRFNMPKGGESATNWVATDPLFVIGNGSAAGASRATALMVLKNGNVGVGTTAPFAALQVARTGTGGGDTSEIAVTGEATTGMSLIRASTNSNGAQIDFLKTRGSQTARTPVVSGDQLGSINFRAYEGSTYRTAASITSAIDNTPGVNDVPGNIVFSTTSDGASSPTERARIDSVGNIGIGTNAPSTALDLNGAFNQRGMAAPGLSAAGQGRIYFSSADNKFKVSQNGGAYTDLVGAGGGGTVTEVTGTLPISVATGTSTPVVSIATANTTTAGALTSTDWNTFNNKLTSPLTTKGDLLTRNGATHVRLPVGLDGQVLVPDAAEAAGLKWTNFSVENLKTAGGATQFASAACTAAQTLTWSSLTNTFTCSNIAGLDAAVITTGTIDAARLPASLNPWDAATGGINYAGGKVGIGTTTPAEPLSVGTNSDFRVNGGGGVTSNSGYSSGGFRLNSGSAGYGLLELASPNGAGGRIRFADGQGTWAWDTAIYRSAANQLTIDNNAGGAAGLVVSGATSLATTSGSVGVGTASPGAKLHVGVTTTTGNTVVEALRISHEDSNSAAATGLGASINFSLETTTNNTFVESGRIVSAWDDASNGSKDGSMRFHTMGPNAAAGTTTASEKMRLNSLGYLGIGTTDPQAPLHVNGAIVVEDGNINKAGGMYVEQSIATMTIAQGNNGALTEILMEAGQNFRLDFGNVERFRVDSTGYVGILTPAPAYPLDVVGDIRTSQCLRYNASTLGVCSSDERIKKDIHVFGMGLKEILGIQPKYFKYNGLGGEPVSEQEQMGVIAQEVEKVAPQLISTKSVTLNPGDKEKTEIKTVNYGAFTYMLINAVKELYNLLDSKADRSEVEQLRAENAALKAYVCSKDPAAPICR